MTLIGFIYDFSNIITNNGGIVTIGNLDEDFFKICRNEISEYDLMHSIRLSYRPDGAIVDLAMLQDDYVISIKLSIKQRNACAVVITLIEMGLYKVAYCVFNNKRMKWDNIIEDILYNNDLEHLEKYLYIEKHIPEVVELSRKPMILSRHCVEYIMQIADYMINKEPDVWVLKKNVIMKYASDFHIMTYKEEIGL